MSVILQVDGPHFHSNGTAGRRQVSFTRICSAGELMIVRDATNGVALRIGDRLSFPWKIS